MIITYDELLVYLREEAAKGRIFESGFPPIHDGAWSCHCPIASYAKARGAIYARCNGQVLLVDGDQQRLDPLLVEFTLRVDDVADKSPTTRVSADVALKILEAVV